MPSNSLSDVRHYHNNVTSTIKFAIIELWVNSIAHHSTARHDLVRCGAMMMVTMVAKTIDRAVNVASALESFFQYSIYWQIGPTPTPRRPWSTNKTKWRKPKSHVYFLLPPTPTPSLFFAVFIVVFVFVLLLTKLLLWHTNYADESPEMWRKNLCKTTTTS